MSVQAEMKIGLEVHVQLDTKSKLFCRCSTLQSAEPNTNVCPICLGHPGTRPLLNKSAVDHAIKACIALNSSLNSNLIFSRKTYFYPDLPKGFQITQYEEPLGAGGYVQLSNLKKINIRRVHIEEDPASLIHVKSNDSECCNIDFNRSGIPLVEVVTEPDISSPAEARDFIKTLSSLLQYIGVYDPQLNTMKADVNISLKESNFTRVEIKNVSGFKDVESALNYEIIRQRSVLRKGGTISHETRRYDEKSKTTKGMRAKEFEEDYGYILEPDIPIRTFSTAFIDLIKKRIPELPVQKAARYVNMYGIDEVNSYVIASSKTLSVIFEKSARASNPILASQWIRRELLRVLNYNEKEPVDIDFGDEFIELLQLLQHKKITQRVAQKILEKLVNGKFSPVEYIKKNKLAILTSGPELQEAVNNVVEQNSEAVSDYKSGKQKAFEHLFGSVMRQLKGRANPSDLRSILKKRLDSIS